MENCEIKEKTKLEKLEEENKKLNYINESLRCENLSLKEQIKVLRQRIEESDGPEAQIAELKELLEHRMNRIRELDSQHQSDCIRINELTVTLDTLVDRYANLRKIHGVS